MNKAIKYLYFITLLFLTLSGFGQMPIAKRYYISDLPGMAWMAKFFVTHYIHYVAGAVFLCIAAYLVVDYFLSRKEEIKITASGYVKSFFLLILIVSGFTLVYNNFEGTYLDSGIVFIMAIAHLLIAMLLLFFSLFTVIAKKKWAVQRKDNIK